MKDLFRILVTGYLIRRFLAPRIYPVIDEIIEVLPEVPELPLLPEKAELPPEVEAVLLVNRAQIIDNPDLVIDQVVYPRRRA
jgi:hypothetical protein